MWGCRDSKRPRHGRNDCLRTGQGRYVSSVPVRQQDSIKGTSGNPKGLLTSAGYAGTAMIRRRENHKNPFPRVKGGYCGHGLGSLVTCRHRLLVSRRRTRAGLHTPVPGVSSRAVMPPDNTAHIFQKGYSKGTRAGHISSQNEDTARTGAVLPAHHWMKDLTP